VVRKLFTTSGDPTATHHQGSTLDVHESREVLDLIGGGQLATSCNTESEEALVQDRLKVCTSGIDGGGVAGGA
jgi:hypothetical protein